MKKYNDEIFQKKLNKRAFILLGNHFNEDLTEESLKYLFDFGSFLDRSDRNLSEINKYLDYLFSLKDREIESLLWNTVSLQNLKKSKYGDYFEKSYLTFRENRVNGITNVTNITPIIKCKKCILQPATSDEIDFLIKQLEKDPSEFKKGFDASWEYYGHWYRKVFIIKNFNNNIVGEIGLINDAPYTHSIEYYVLPEFRKKGFVSDALKFLLDAAFNNQIKSYAEDDLFRGKYECKVEEIKLLTININKNNKISNLIAKTFNFHYDGIIKEYVDGVFEIHNKYSITRDEYFNLKNNI